MTEDKHGEDVAPAAVSHQVGRVSVVDLHGTLDAASLRGLEPGLIGLADRTDARLAIDLRDVSSVDSSGLGLLLSLTKRARAHGGDVVLFGIPASVDSVFRVTGIKRVIRVFDEEQVAIAALLD